jgi:phosphatidylethanolamine/phosphatidyl-N-methylethanolamine N-methyltransferase
MASREEILDGFYADDYSRIAATATDSRAARYLHRSMEKGLGPDARFARVLELGGNRGEHVPYVRHAFDDYHLTDLRMPQPPDVVRRDPRIRVAAVDAARTGLADREFDRVIATCLLHHVDDPMGVAQEMRRVTTPGGVVSILLPTDPGLAYRSARWLTSGRLARREGVAEESRLLHALDHRNHFRSIAVQLREVFRRDDVHVSWRPTRLRSVELNLLTVWHVTVR